MILDLQKNGALLAAGIAIGVAGHAVVGGALGAAWRLTPWSAVSKLETARDRLAETAAELRAERAARVERDLAIAERDGLMRQLGAQAAVDQADTVARWGAQCQAAYQAGVAFGRALTRPSPNTGAADASRSTDRPVDRAAAAGGLRPSFRSEWSAGAFRPAGSAAAGGVPRPGGG